jgi:hypothetical protein
MERPEIGDKVKFLNEKGGGVVTAYANPHTALVLSDDGFEIPILIRNLVVYDRAAPSQQQKEDIPFSTGRPLSMSDLMPGVHLAYVMQPGSIIAGAADLYLVNNSSFSLLYSIYRSEDKILRSFSKGQLDARSVYMLQICPSDGNERLLRGVVQVLFYGTESISLIEPLQSEFRIKPMRLLESANYQRYTLFDSPAIMLHLGSPERAAKEPNPVATPAPARHERLLKPFRQSDDSVIVDLHIEKLSEDYRGLSPAETLQIQLGYFEGLLSAALQGNVRKLILIHGVGNGILKAEIRKRLSDLEGVVYFDAPMRLYGLGATEVLLG